MIGNILGEPFSDYVFTQIEQRQKIQGKGLLSSRTAEDINYLSNRNAWIKLASGVEVESNKFGELRLQELDKNSDFKDFKGVELAKKSILFNGISGLEKIDEKFVLSQREGIRQDFGNGILSSNSVYGFGDKEFGFTPPPGIISAEIDCINRGSIRQATIILKAYNKFQFELIELLYLRVGFSMFLEWGWDKYLDDKGVVSNMGNTLIETFWFEGDGKSQLEVLDKIEKERENYHGNYDGFFGKVSNFSWTLTKDGTYDITLKLITVGDVIESLKVNIPVQHSSLDPNTSIIKDSDINIKKSTSLESIRIKEIYKSSIVKNFYNNSISQWLIDTIALWDIESQPNTPIPLRPINDFFQIPGDFISNKHKGELLGYTYYVRLGKFLEILQDLIIPIVNNGGDTYPVLDIDYGFESNLINLKDSIFPIDPRICIVNMEGLIKNKSFLDSINKNLEPFITDTGEKKKAYLMNLYINFDFLSKISSSNSTSKNDGISLFKFLENLCDGINYSFGGYTKLEPIIKDDRIITIIDQKVIPEILNNNSEKNNPQLEIFGYDRTNNQSNFIKDISFNTKISPALSSQISIGATSGDSTSSIIEGTAFSRWNVGLVDRFAKVVNYLPPREINNEIPTNSSEMQEFWNKGKTVGSGTDSEVVLLKGPLPVLTVQSKRNETRVIVYKSITYPSLTFKAWRKKYNKINSTDKLAEELKNKTQHLYIKSWDDYINQAFTKITKYDPKNLTDFRNPSIIGDIYYFDYNPNFIQRGMFLFESYIKKFKNEKFKETKQPSDLMGFLPITLDITTEGLSGIKIYQKLNIRQRILPYQYDESFVFLITKVNHKIENNNWDTMLGTLSTSNIKESIENSVKSKKNNINNKSTNKEGECNENKFRDSLTALRLSIKGGLFLQSLEGFSKTSYPDAGSVAIGYGFNKKGLGEKFVKENNIDYSENAEMDQHQANIIFNKIISTLGEDIKNLVIVHLTQNEFDALISLTYNIGIGNFSKSTLLKHLNSGNYCEAAQQILVWNKSEDQYNISLSKRRHREYKLFNL